MVVGDAGQFARKTHRLFEEPELAKRFSENGRRRIRDEFTVAQMVNRHRQLYEELAG